MVRLLKSRWSFKARSSEGPKRLERDDSAADILLYQLSHRHRQQNGASPVALPASHILDAGGVVDNEDPRLSHLSPRAVDGNDINRSESADLLSHASRALEFSRNGVALEEDGNIDAAIEAYREAIALDADCVDAHYNLGVVLAKRGDVAESSAAYRRAIELNPEHADAHNNLGSILETDGLPDAAIVEYSRAIESSPQHAAARFNLANVLHSRGRINEAIAEYRVALKLEPGDAEACNSLGVALETRGRLDEAIDAYRLAVSRRPDYLVALENLGGALRAKGDHFGATTVYTELLAKHPDKARIQAIMAHSLRQSSPKSAQVSHPELRGDDDWSPSFNTPLPSTKKSASLHQGEERKEDTDTPWLPETEEESLHLRESMCSVVSKASSRGSTSEKNKHDVTHLAIVEKLADLACGYVLNTLPLSEHSIQLIDRVKKIRDFLIVLRDDMPVYTERRGSTFRMQQRRMPQLVDVPGCETMQSVEWMPRLDTRGTNRIFRTELSNNLLNQIDPKVLKMTECVLHSCELTTKRWHAKGAVSKRLQGCLFYKGRFRSLKTKLDKCKAELQAALPAALRSRRLRQLFVTDAHGEMHEESPAKQEVNVYVFEPPDPDRNEAQSLLGKGRFGRTHLMKSSTTRRRRAVRIINVERAEAHGVDLKLLVRDLFKAEELRHPHIVRYFGAFFDRDGRDLCIPMEFVAGGTLDLQVRSRHDFDTLQLWIRQLSGALAYMHSRGFVHGQLRPEHVFLSYHNKCIKLADAGLVALTPGATKHKHGAELYFSPERFNNHPFGEKDDMWALGCIIVELAAGKRIEAWCTRRQYFCVDRLAMRKAIAETKASSPEIGDIAKKLFERDPEQRSVARTVYRWICGLSVEVPSHLDSLASESSGGDSCDGAALVGCPSAALNVKLRSSEVADTLLPVSGLMRRAAKDKKSLMFSDGDGEKSHLAEKIDRARERLHHLEVQFDWLLDESREQRLEAALLVTNDRGELRLAASSLEHRFPGLGGLMRRVVADKDEVREEAARAIVTFCKSKWQSSKEVAEPVTIRAMARLVIAGAPEVKEAALLVLRHLAIEDRVNRLAIVSFDGALAAVARMLDGLTGVGAKNAAASLISHVAVTSGIKALLGNKGAVSTLVAMLDASLDATTLEESLTALMKLVKGSAANQVVARRAGAAPRLVSIIEAGGSAAETATHALKSLIVDSDDAADFANAAPVPAICRLLRSQDSDNQLKEVMAIALRKIASKSDSFRAEIAAAGAIPGLVDLLFDATSTDSACQAAIRALSNLAYKNPQACADIGKMVPSVVYALIQFIDSRATGSDGLRDAATSALLNLLVDDQNRCEFITSGGIATVVKLVSNHRAAGAAGAASILRLLATSENSTTLELLYEFNAIPALVSYMSRTKSESGRSTAIWALKEMASTDVEYQVAIADTGAIIPLIHFIDLGASEEVREAAAWALKMLTKTQRTRIKVASALGNKVNRRDMLSGEHRAATELTMTEGQVDELIDKRKKVSS